MLGFLLILSLQKICCNSAKVGRGIPSQLIPIPTFISYSSKIHIDIMLPPTVKYPMWPLPDKNIVYMLHFPLIPLFYLIILTIFGENYKSCFF